jgi:hypothetical protein
VDSASWVNLCLNYFWNILALLNLFQKSALLTIKEPNISRKYPVFSEAYPEMEIQDIQLAYNISRVSVLDKERWVDISGWTSNLKLWHSKNAKISSFPPFIYIYRPPLWSSGKSSWLQIRRPEFDSRHYQKKKAVGLERGPLSLVSTTEELLDREVAAPV